MKALLSPLAKDLLADPEALERLRAFLAAEHGPRPGEEGPRIPIRNREGKVVVVKPVFVPRAG